jgi:lysophospholipase
MSSAAAEFAPSPGLPGPLDPTATARFYSRDGTALYGEWFEPDEARGRVLIMHGYAEHCGRYREVAHVLHRMGLASLSYDMRGHGRSQGQRGHIDSIRDYLDDMDAALAELDERFRRRYGDPGDRPLFLVCHSNGALVALRALADPLRRPRGVDAAVLSSPFLGLKVRVSPVKDLVGRAASRWAPRLSLPNELRIEDLTRDEGKLAERRVDTLCHDVASARWYQEALRAHHYVLRNAPRVRTPTLWLVAADDRIAAAPASRAVRARLRVPAEYHELAGMYHEVFNERDRGRVFELLRAALEGRITQS